jgi:hypothetical protein
MNKPTDPGTLNLKLANDALENRLVERGVLPQRRSLPPPGPVLELGARLREAAQRSNPSTAALLNDTAEAVEIALEYLTCGNLPLSTDKMVAIRALRGIK